MPKEVDAIVIDARDNVATAIRNLGNASLARTGRGSIPLLQDIQFGHKYALRDIQEGDYVVKYGAQIGRATVPIRRGEHVHVHNVQDIVDEVRKVG